MAIKIIEDGPDITLTRSEYNRLYAEYSKAFMLYAGTPPTFEEWVRERLEARATRRCVLLKAQK